MIPITEPEITRFAEQLGRMMIRLPLVSAGAGHKWPIGTVKDYLRISSPEAEFLIDLLSKPIAEILVKWYPRNGLLFSHPDCNVSAGPDPRDLKKLINDLPR